MTKTMDKHLLFKCAISISFMSASYARKYKAQTLICYKNSATVCQVISRYSVVKTSHHHES